MNLHKFLSSPARLVMSAFAALSVVFLATGHPGGALITLATSEWLFFLGISADCRCVHVFTLVLFNMLLLVLFYANCALGGRLLPQPLEGLTLCAPLLFFLLIDVIIFLTLSVRNHLFKGKEHPALIASAVSPFMAAALYLAGVPASVPVLVLYAGYAGLAVAFRDWRFLSGHHAGRSTSTQR